ncbi:MAG: hypothetical protein V1720_21480 [bacterium]
MKRIIIFILFCGITSVFSQTESKNVHGRITTYDFDSPPVFPCLLSFINESSNEKIDTTTKEDGYYEIALHETGKYLLQIISASYNFIQDTILINDKNNSLEFNYKLSASFGYLEKIDFPPKYLDYQKILSERYGNNIITLTLDSLIWNGPYLKFIPTFKNNTNEFIYLLHPEVIYSPFDYIITNSSGDTLNGNMLDMYHDVNVHPLHDISEADLIELHPFSSYYCNPINVEWYDFSGYPPDKYTMKIVYEYTYGDVVRRYFRHNNPPETPLPAELIRAKGLALRGRYESVNSITFDNSEITNIYRDFSTKPSPGWIK